MFSDTEIREQLATLAEKPRLATLDPAAMLGGYRTQRRRRVAGAAAGVTLLLAGAVGAAVVWPTGPTDSVGQFGNGSQSPGFTPESGRYWLIDTPTPRHSDGTFYDPEDEDNVPTASQSPYPEAPYAELSAALLEEVNRAGLPVGTQVVATKDEVGLASVHITLPDGTPMIAMRGRYTHPIRFRMSSADGIGLEIRVADIAGSNSAALLDPAFGYGFPRPHRTPTSNGVVVVTREGVTTTWAAPSTVIMQRLQSWAFVAARATSG